MALWTLFFGFALLMIGNGLNLAVIGVRMVDEGFGARTSGLVMACYFAGFLLGPILVVRWLSGVGHIRVFAEPGLDRVLAWCCFSSCGSRRRVGRSCASCSGSAWPGCT